MTPSSMRRALPWIGAVVAAATLAGCRAEKAPADPGPAVDPKGARLEPEPVARRDAGSAFAPIVPLEEDAGEPDSIPPAVDAATEAPSPPASEAPIRPDARDSAEPSCAPGLHFCGDKCLRNDEVDHCGALCRPCRTPDDGHATCDGQRCGIVCDVGFHLCGDACLSDANVNSCGTRCERCPQPERGYPVCVKGTCGSSCGVDQDSRAASTMGCPDPVPPRR